MLVLSGKSDSIGVQMSLEMEGTISFFKKKNRKENYELVPKMSLGEMYHAWRQE